MFRKKWLASLISIIMVFAFMPISSFAITTGGEAEPATKEAVAAETETQPTTEAVHEDAQPQTKATEAPAEEQVTVEEEINEGAASEEPAKEEPVSEEAEEENDTVDMPAQSFSETAGNGISVSVSAPEGAFPEGTAMKVASVSHARAISLVEGAAEDVVDANGVDITFYKGGKEIQPKKAIKVSLSNADVEGESFNVYHVADNGSVDRVAGASSDGASFRASSFSIYIVGGSGDEETPYTATYTFKNGDEVVDTQIVKDGETLNKPEAPEKDGYKFIGWYDGDKEFKSFGKQTVSENSDITLNAKFQEAHYVFFKHPEGGIYTTKEGVKGDRITTSDVVITISASSSAHKWYTDEACTKQVASVTLEDSNIYLYTKAEEGHWLTFDSNGGSFVASEFIDAGENTIRPADPTKAGYNFAGWKLNGANFNFGRTINQNTTVTAAWTAKNNTKYTVMHWQENADDAGYSFVESEAKTGTTGANTAAAAKSYNGFTAQAITQKTIAGDGTTIVNVYYKRNMYTFTFNEKSLFSTTTVHTFTAKWGSDISDKWHFTGSNGKQYPQTNPPTSWTPSGSRTYTARITRMEIMPAENITFTHTTTSNKARVFYYYVESLGDGVKTFEGKKYDQYLKLDHDFNQIYYNDDFFNLKGFTRYKIATTTGTVINKNPGSNWSWENSWNSQLCFYYSRNSYNIVFMNNGTQDKSVSKKYEASIADANYTPNRPSNIPAAYTFGGWYDNELCEGTAYSFSGKTMPANNITLYAKWVAPEEHAIIHISFSGNSESHIVPYGQKISSEWLKTPKDLPEGTTFVGWGTKAEDGSLQLFDTNQPIYSDIELFPICSDYSKTHTVEYDANGGKGTVTDSDKYHEHSRAQIKSAKGLTAPEGKVFNGWNTKADGSGTMYQPGDKISIGNADVVLYAQWGDKVAGTSIVYHSNYPDESSDDTDTQKLKNNEKIKLSTAEKCGFTTPKGYVFEGWSDSPSGAVKYEAGQKVLVDNLSSNDLYAKWKCVEVTVKITGNKDTKFYNGEDQSATGYTTDIGDKDVKISLKEGHKAEATGKDIGEYPMNLTADDFVATSDTYGKINIEIVSDGSLTINPKEVTVTVKDASKAYGDTDPAFTAKEDGIVDGFKLDYKISRTNKDENVGTYKGVLVAEGASTQGNYTVKYVPGDFEITKSDRLTVIGVPYEGVYDAKAHGEAATASVTEGTTISYKVDGGDWSTEVPTITEVGTKTVTVKAENSNYETATATYTLKVTPAEVTVTVQNANKVYGTDDPQFAADVTGVVDDYKIDYSISRTNDDEEVGTYEGVLVADGAKEQGNYTVKYVPGDFEITKAGTLTVTGTPYEGVYDAQAHGSAASANITEGTTISYSVDGGQWTETVPTITEVGTKTVEVKAENSNYETATATYTLKVTPAEVTVTVQDASKVYGTDDPQFKADVTGVIDEFKIDYSISRTNKDENVGTYEGVLVADGSKTQGNYTVTYVPGDFEITKSDELTVSGVPYEGVYDAKAHGEAAEASVTEGTTISYKVGDGEWTTEVPTITNVGEVTVEVKAENSNYETATATYTLKVTPAEVTVTVQDSSKVYGTDDPQFEAEVTGLVDDFEIDYSISRTNKDENVGTYNDVLVAEGDAVQGNYTVTYVPGNFEITKAETLTVNGVPYEGVYDAKAHGEAAEASVTEGTTISYKVGDGEWTTEVPTITEVGTKTVTVKAENSNYETATSTYTLKVTPAEVTVTVKDSSKVYGTDDPQFEAEVTGIVDDFKIDYSISRTNKDENVGTYEGVLVAEGAKEQGNYTVKYVPGDFEITRAETLTVNGVPYEGVYDAKAHGEAAKASVTEGTTISYRVDGGEWTTEVPTITNVGEVTVEVKAENENYKTATATYTLKVTPAEVTVTVQNSNKVYGDKDPEFKADVTGVVDDYTIKYEISRTNDDEEVGTYEGVLVADGAKEQDNYTVKYVPGDFEITKAGTLTVTGTDYNGKYDAKAHGEAATASVTEGTTISYKVGDGEWTTEVPTITNVGEVTVEVKAENSNYETATATYTLKVTPAEVTVTVQDADKVYGTDDPEFTADVTGVVDDYKIDYSISRTNKDENVGTYDDVLVADGAKTQGNYTVTYVPADFEITKSDELTVSGTPYEGVYDAKAHGEAAKASVTEGTTISYRVGDGEWTTEVPTITNVGEVTVEVKAENSNYVTATATYTLKVNPAEVTVTVQDAEKVYGDKDPEFKAEVKGLKDDYKLKYEISRTNDDENVGTYEGVLVAEGDAVQGNYTVTYVPGDFEITKAGTLTVSGVPYEGVYDAKAHGEAATASVTEGTTISYKVGDGKWTTEVPTVTEVDEITVEVKAENSNYETATSTYTLKVTPAPVTVTVNKASKVYGEEDPVFTAKEEGIVDDFQLDYRISRTNKDENVGTYEKVLVAKGEALQGNYTVTYVPGDFEITKAGTLTVIGTPYEGVYDAKTHGEAAEANITEGTTISYKVDGGEWTTEVPTIKNVGTKTVEVKAENSNYKTATSTYTLNVTPAPVTVTVQNASKVYGTDDPQFIAEVTGVIDDFEVVYNISRTNDDENVGTYNDVLVAKGDAAQGNYTVAYVPADFEITKAGTLTVTGTDYSGKYDAKAHGSAASANITEGTTISYSVDGGQWTETVPTITEVGTKTVEVKAENSNYETATATYTLKVTPAEVTVTVQNAGKVYGTDDPEFTADVTGVVDDYKIDYSISRTNDDENVGTYNDVLVAKGDAAQGNYTVTYVPGDFEITKSDKLKVIGIPYEGVYDAKIHGEAAKANVTEGTTVSYRVDGGEWTTTFPTIKDVGTKTVEVKAENSNYETATTTYTLKVTPAEVTVRVQNADKVYGTEDPEFKADVKGVVDEYKIDYSISRTNDDENVGKYEGVLVAKGDAVQGNYVVEYVAGDFEITKSDKLTVSGTDYSGMYDGKAHGEAAKANVTEGTTISYKVGIGEWTTEVPTITNAGEVTVEVKAENSNYETATATYTLEVTKRNVILRSASDSKVYDGKSLTNNHVSVEGDGFVEGEGAAYTVNGSQLNAGSSINTFSYEANEGTDLGNYTIEKKEGTLKVTKALLTVKADNKSKVAGKVNPKLTYTITEFKGSDSVKDIKGNPLLRTTAKTNSPAGKYPITVNGKELTAQNYDFRFVDGTLTVTSAPAPGPKPDPTPTPDSAGSDNGNNGNGQTVDNTVKVGNDNAPSGNVKLEGSWALLNLLLTILTCIFSIILLITYFTRKREDEEEDEEKTADYAAEDEQDEKEIKKKGIWRVISVVWAVLMIIVFFLTEDMSLPMVFTDKWTLLMIIMTIVQIIIMIVSKKKYDDDEEEDEQQMA